MSNLEWLNQQIEETKKSYDAFVLDYELFHRIGDKRDADKLKEILKRLQQIKCELEAWEVVKENVNVYGHEYNGELVEYVQITEEQLPDEKHINIIKKAKELEVENANM
jgi:hypothetical protein